jgi:signal transduction histidine kinase
MGYLLLEVMAVTALFSRFRRTQNEGRAAWGLLALSAFLEIPNLVETLFIAWGHTFPGASTIRDLLSLGTGFLVLAGVLSFPVEQGRGSMFRRRILDGLIFAASILFLLWVMGVQVLLRSSASDMGIRVMMAYLNVALLGGGIVFITAYHPDRLRGSLGWLGGSALAWIAAISCWTLAGLPSDLNARPWMPLAGGIPLFQALAALAPLPSAEHPGVGLIGRRLARMLPYFPVMLAITVLAILLPRASMDVMRGAIGIFLIMVVLLLLRQMQAIRDLSAAQKNLEDRVQQRTQALEQAQDMLLRTERMNTLALMGAGLAHDLNNLLSVVKGSADMVSMNLTEGRPPEPKDLTRITAASDRAAMLTQRLLSFVRQETEELTPLDLGRGIRDMEPTLLLLLPKSVTLHLEVAPGPPLVVHSSQLRLEQMLVNLVANARDAMPEGGTLTIRTGLETPGAPHALIEVADTGCGMTPDVQERIFEPFYTTKGPGKGTGLGLPSLQAMVQEGQGRVEVRSTPGQGSQFRIFLPRTSSEAITRR